MRDKKVTFITEGSSRIGLGHVMRCVAIAEQLRESKIKPVFIVNKDRTVSCILKKYRFFFEEMENIFQSDFQSVKGKTVLIDSKKDVSNIIKKLKKNNCKITLVDNITEARLLADNIIYPLEHFNPDALDWSKAKGKIYYGAKYFPIRKELLKVKQENSKTKKNSILISFGGADPNNLTFKILKAFKKISPKNDFIFKVILGPAFKKENCKRIADLSRKLNFRVKLIKKSNNLKDVYKDVLFAITAMGVSIYEFNYFRIPVILLYNYRSDEEDAEILEQWRIIKNLGYYKEVTRSGIKKAVENFIDKKGRIKGYVDGKGAKRIGQIIVRGE